MASSVAAVGIQLLLGEWSHAEAGYYKGELQSLAECSLIWALLHDGLEAWSSYVTFLCLRLLNCKWRLLNSSHFVVSFDVNSCKGLAHVYHTVNTGWYPLDLPAQVSMLKIWLFMTQEVLDFSKTSKTGMN